MHNISSCLTKCFLVFNIFCVHSTYNGVYFRVLIFPVLYTKNPLDAGAGTVVLLMRTRLHRISRIAESLSNKINCRVIFMLQTAHSMSVLYYLLSISISLFSFCCFCRALHFFPSIFLLK